MPSVRRRGSSLNAYVVSTKPQLRSSKLLERRSNFTKINGYRMSHITLRSSESSRFERIWKAVHNHNGIIKTGLCCAFLGTDQSECTNAHTCPHSNSKTFNQEAWLMLLGLLAKDRQEQLIAKMLHTNRLPLNLAWSKGLEPGGCKVLVPTYAFTKQVAIKLEEAVNAAELSTESFSRFNPRSVIEDIGEKLKVDGEEKPVILYEYQVLIFNDSRSIVSSRGTEDQLHRRITQNTLPAVFKESLPTSMLPIDLIYAILMAWMSLSLLIKQDNIKISQEVFDLKSLFEYILEIVESDRPSHFRQICRPTQLMGTDLPNSVPEERLNVTSRFDPEEEGTIERGNASRSTNRREPTIPRWMRLRHMSPNRSSSAPPTSGRKPVPYRRGDSSVVFESDLGINLEGDSIEEVNPTSEAAPFTTESLYPERKELHDILRSQNDRLISFVSMIQDSDVPMTSRMLRNLRLGREITDDEDNIQPAPDAVNAMIELDIRRERVADILRDHGEDIDDMIASIMHT